MTLDLDARIAALATELSLLRAQKKKLRRRGYKYAVVSRPYNPEYWREYRQRPSVKLRRKLREAGLSRQAIQSEMARAGG